MHKYKGTIRLSSFLSLCQGVALTVQNALTLEQQELLKAGEVEDVATGAEGQEEKNVVDDVGYMTPA